MEMSRNNFNCPDLDTSKDLQCKLTTFTIETKNLSMLFQLNVKRGYNGKTFLKRSIYASITMSIYFSSYPFDGITYASDALDKQK
jgi:hypothetical protein